MSVKRSTYIIPTTEPHEPNGNGNGSGHGDLSLQKRTELWGMFTRHLIGLATVIWWMVYKEPPPKGDLTQR